MKTKLMSVVLAAVLLLGLAVPAMAADEPEFVIQNHVLLKYNGDGGDVVIPDGVREIYEGVFRYFESPYMNIGVKITSVTIPSSVTKIGKEAFFGCSSLTSINIPSGVTEIGEEAFAGCSSLTSINIPSGVTNIGKNAFISCSGLTSVTIPSGVTSLVGAFSGCTSLTSVTIPDGVTNIMGAFNGCSSLTSVTIPSSVTNISGAFKGCSSLTSVTIPSSVTNIGGAFNGCSSLTSVTIPASVTNFGGETFNECSSLTSVNIPSGVTEIGEQAFRNCSSLTSVTIPSSVTYIKPQAFFNCTSLTSVTISHGCGQISDVAFAGCTSLTSISIPASVGGISNDAFAGCGSLSDVYYGGTQEKWEKFKFNDFPYMNPLLRVNIHYNSTMPGQTEQPTPTPTTTSFADVPADAYYAEAVKWAVEKEITNGTSANTFSPDTTCNTAQILTFLWRACGSPKSNAANSFTDVAGDAYYYDAAQWAKAQGMISGSALSPETPCTRASTVMYIWQAAGRPAASKAASFADVPADADYAAAVAWAVEKGVTNGTGADTFSPNTTCTRGQIATFLNRAFA